MKNTFESPALRAVRALDDSPAMRAIRAIDHDVIGNISINKKLMELERDRDWVKVEYFDHINNVNVVGWAHSRYLLAITPGGKE